MTEALAIGELLWDLFPDDERLGGAPANVAYSLRQVGRDAGLFSCVGDDERGRAAIAQLRSAGLDSNFIASNADFPTGTVQISLDKAGVPSFSIARKVAWDNIPWSLEMACTVSSCKAIVFGTLAQRDKLSRKTINAALQAANGALKVLDLNFRPPFISSQIVRLSLENADILKLNEDELAQLPTLLEMTADEDFPATLAEAFDIRRIYMTLGKRGCDVLDFADSKQRLHADSPAVEVVDTVGAGDAFTAALVDGELKKLSLERIAENACAAGAFVASQAGAMPEWPVELRARFNPT